MNMNTSLTARRNVLKTIVATGVAVVAQVAMMTGPLGRRRAEATGKGIGAMMPGKGWISRGRKCDGDGTPLQFIPRTEPDEKPLENELEKYPTCPYCGMNRTMWSHSRHLVQFDDNLVDATCSIHCLAVSLSLNLDRGIKALYAADFGDEEKIKPMVAVDKAIYLIGSRLKGTMTSKSKMAFSSHDRAVFMQGKKGGQLATFDQAIRETYLNMADDTRMIRKRRMERQKRS